MTHNKVVLQLYPETSSDTPIGERDCVAMANNSALDGSTLTHKQSCECCQAGRACVQGPGPNHQLAEGSEQQLNKFLGQRYGP